MFVKMRKCNTKKLIKNSKKIRRILWEENKQFSSFAILYIYIYIKFVITGIDIQGVKNFPNLDCNKNEHCNFNMI